MKNYQVRTYVLPANEPVALQAGRKYAIISASVNPGLLSFAYGDANADFEPWPFGLVLNLEKRTTVARIRSSVAQSVTVAIAEGDFNVEDSRCMSPVEPYGARISNPITSINQTIGSGTIGTLLVNSANNVRGCIVNKLDFTLNSTVATACEFYVRTTGTISFVMFGRIEAGAILAAPYSLPEPLYLDAGIGLDCGNVVSPAGVTVRGSCRFLP